MGDYEKIKEKVRDLLGTQLGVEKEDIQEDDSLVEDLHMNAGDITDLIQLLSQNGFETSKINFADIITFQDLVEVLAEESGV